MRILLLFVVSALCALLHAQFPEPHVWMLPDLLAKEKGDLSTSITDAHYYKGQLVSAQEIERKDETIFRLSLHDVHTDEVVARGPDIRQERSANLLRTDLLVSGDHAYLIEKTYDKSSNVLAINAWHYSLPSLDLAPNRIPVVSFNVQDTPLNFGAYASVGELIQSDDGTKIAYVNFLLGSTDDEQSLLVQTFSSDLSPLNELQTYKFNFAADRIRKAGLKVSDQGSVFVLMKENNEKNDFTKKTANYNYQLYCFNGGEPMNQPVLLPASMIPSKIDLSMTEGGPRIAGFFVEPAESIDDAVGCFIVDYDPDLSKAPTIADVFRFEQPVKEPLWVAEMMPTLTGESYLVVMTYKSRNDGMSIMGTSVIVIAFGKDRRFLWKTVVPRNFNSQLTSRSTYKKAIVRDKLYLFFPDTKANLGHYQSGENVKYTLKYEVTVIASFDEQGLPSFEQFNTEDHPFSMRNGFRPVSHDTFYTRFCPEKRGPRTGCNERALITFD